MRRAFAGWVRVASDSARKGSSFEVIVLAYNKAEVRVWWTTFPYSCW
jgi:hypothetical protein